MLMILNNDVTNIALGFPDLAELQGVVCDEMVWSRTVWRGSYVNSSSDALVRVVIQCFHTD
jgi:hypothetical protein